MPKASASAASRSALRRNQACLSCRKRKLKCDAARPHCGTCVKQWQALISVPPPVGYAHPTEPQCSYDPVDGLPIAPEVDPIDRIRLLEEQISTLRSQLNEARNFNSGSASPPHQYPSPHQRVGSGLSGGSAGRSPTLSSPNGSSTIVSPTMEMVNGVSMESPESQLRGSSSSPQILQPTAGRGNDPMMMDVLFSGWDPDLPDSEVLNHYIEVFFRCDPCGSRVLHRPTFLTSMHLHPKDPNFPHSAVLHAICASASRWASHDIITMPDGTRRDRFAEFHVSKTRSYIDRTMASGQDIFPVMQACTLLSWYFYQEGRWVEVWIFAGFQTRVAIPLRLNYPGTFSAAQGGSSPGAYLAPPKDFKELECRRRSWWMTIMFDRIVSVGGWLHGVDERDIGTEFPLRSIDFELNSNIPGNPQDLATKDVFVRHIPSYTDSFLLFLKAVMLFGRVTDHNTRTNLRAPQLKTQNPFSTPGFEELDRLVGVEFLQCLPQNFKHLGLGEDGALDTDLYMVHVVPHAAAITLHNSYIDFNDSQSVSTSRCMNATRSILSAYYSLSETSLDISRLHPFVTICWYLAAVVQIQLCKYFIEINDTARESTVWGEINVLRFAMLEYGNRSPIGTRQEKLLQGLMTEIVRMTTQMHPLEMGVPLYPFSHSGVFPINKDGAAGDGGGGAPLPNSTPYDEQTDAAPTSLRGAVHTPPMGVQRAARRQQLPHEHHDAGDMTGWRARAAAAAGPSARTYMPPNLHPAYPPS
ncbi:Zn(II)2Cys6 transcription factor [Phanerochaete sordida]|uniref:Zn(II)2Cys6 transcription factor n=1 Tax=Phanerochaete sordida TaxID=48140 RepID=A0A9P3G4D5_9APHY|nr:Zn(II)2Cys6 transcription factor [Phanerochaete sordida]